MVAYLQGVYAVAPERLADLFRRVARTVFGTITIVLITTTILYPVIIALTHRVAIFSADLLELNLNALSLLGCAIAKRDSDTDAHNFRVTICAVRLAEARNLPVVMIRRLLRPGDRGGKDS